MTEKYKEKTRWFNVNLYIYYHGIEDIYQDNKQTQ